MSSGCAVVGETQHGGRLEDLARVLLPRLGSFLSQKDTKSVDRADAAVGGAIVRDGHYFS